MTHYHTYDHKGSLKLDIGIRQFDSLVDDMKKLRDAGASAGIVDASFDKIGSSLNGLPIPALKIGKNSANKVLFIGCHHAREWISVEVPYLIAKYLINNYKSAPTTKQEKWVKYLVDHAQIFVVPMANPDGHRRGFNSTTGAAVTGGDAWRANCASNVYDHDVTFDRYVEKKPYKTIDYKGEKYELYRLTTPVQGKKIAVTIKTGTYLGTDLNRNYPVAAPPAGSTVPEWGVETHGEPGGYAIVYTSTGAVKEKKWYLTTSREPEPPTTFCGKSAGSEPETSAVAALLRKEKFKAVFDYHSYSQLILYPDDVDLFKDDQVHFLGQGMHQLFKSKQADYTYQSGSALYPTSGDSISFSYRDAKTPHFCIELSPTSNDGEERPRGKGWAFNRLPESEIDRVFAECLPSALAAIKCSIHGFSTSRHTKKVPASTKQAIMNSWKTFWSWKP